MSDLRGSQTIWKPGTITVDSRFFRKSGADEVDDGAPNGVAAIALADFE
jgi:hypothetical protein